VAPDGAIVMLPIAHFFPVIYKKDQGLFIKQRKIEHPSVLWTSPLKVEKRKQALN